MSTYRQEAGHVATEARWTFFRFLPLIAGVLIVLFFLGFGLRSLGLIGGTVVERKVFENSYQRSESIKSRIATDEAALAEIGRQLSNPNLDENTRFNLEAQAAAARVRIQTARSQQ
ncbi:MAG: hypothetical protein N0E44_18030 [Candidatus Thiodiazotropha lotti]|nr:hypothetical protein [Candidatus Thiodiazotropha lotti]MCW4221783.1 hypothetical protein [Candidatus Thiodiazotropha lotti]